MTLRRLLVAVVLASPALGAVAFGASVLLTSGNLSLFSVNAPAPATPQITSSSPTSPADDNSPELIGSADGGTTVRIYTTAGCSGSPVATGSASVFETSGITVSVGDDTSTTFYADAQGASGTSGCSAGFTYVEESLPTCTISWDGGGAPNTSWNTATNWSTNVVPGASDHVCITNPGVTVTYPSGTTSVLSLTASGSGASALTVSGGTLNFTDTTEFTRIGIPLTLSGATIGGAGDILLLGSGTHTWSGGDWTGAGDVTLVEGSAMSKSTGTATMSKPVMTVSGVFNHSGAIIKLPLGSRIDVGGKINWSGGDYTRVGVGNAGRVQILSGGEIEKTGGGSLVMGDDATFRFDNDGLFDLVAGIVTLNSSTTSGDQDLGDYAIASGATLRPRNTRTVGSGGSATGLGTIELNGLSTDVLRFLPGSIYDIDGTTLVTAGKIDLDMTAPVTIDNLTLNGGTVDGDANLTLPSGGTHSWTSGSMIGTGSTTLASLGSMTISGATGVTFGRPLFDIDGTLTHTNGDITLAATSTIRIDGKISDSSGKDYLSSGAAHIYVAAGGEFEKTSGTGDVRIGGGATTSTFVLDNDGLVENLAGTGALLINGFQSAGQEDNGTFTPQAGRLIELTRGRTIGTGGSVSGTGTFEVDAFSATDTVRLAPGSLYTFAGTTNLRGGVFDFDLTSASTQSFNQDDTNTTLDGSGELILNAGGSHTWSQGTWAGSGTTTVPAGATLSVTNAGRTIDQRTLDVRGTVSNAAAAPITLVNGARLKGTGTVARNVINTSGTVAPGASPGTLTIGGTYTQGAGGTLAIEITGTGAGQFDVLSTAGAASLNGTLAIDSTTFTPAIGNTFQILTTSSRSGTFATVTGATVGGRTYNVVYNATNVTLSVS